MAVWSIGAIVQNHHKIALKIQTNSITANETRKALNFIFISKQNLHFNNKNYHIYFTQEKTNFFL